MSPNDAKQKLSAIQKIFSESATTIERLKSVGALARGINPAIDTKLSEYEKHLSLLESASQGDVVELSAEGLPENTEQEKKRKAALLLFIKSYKDLQSEIERVSREMRDAKEAGTSNTSLFGKIFSAAKGPLAIVTVVAVGVAALQITAVEIEVKNDGCTSLTANGAVPTLPGFSLPQGDIPTGGTGTAVVPPLSFQVDGTSSSFLSISALNFNFSFNLGSGIDDVRWNGESLIGVKTTLDLSKSKKHTLEIVCN